MQPRSLMMEGGGKMELFLVNGRKGDSILIALASGNRVSELSAMNRTGLEHVTIFEKFTIPIMPGFLYKNYRLGRTSPNI